MLIYVNQFELIGNESFFIALKTVAGWLKTVTKTHFTIDMLRSGEEFPIGKAKVRTFAACELAPAIYSILLSHPDKKVRGRQWITEIGIIDRGGTTTLSVLLETSDISTLVRDIPDTTRPMLVDFLLKNATLNPKTTIGLSVREIKNDVDSFKALSFEIDRPERNYPLVLVSNCKKNNQPLVNPRELQKYLIGLAQVVWTKDEINSWELEQVLTRQYSAWDGAINIISPALKRGHCYNRLLLGDAITDSNKEENILHRILSYITHTTNGHNKKRHFSPTDVRAKRQKDSRIQLKNRFEELSSDSEYQNLAEEAFSQLEEQETVIDQLKEKHEIELEEQMLVAIKAEDELDKLKAKHQTLTFNFKKLKSATSKEGKPILVFGNENEKYEGEITELVIDVLEDYLDSLQHGTRKHNLISDVLSSNSFDGSRGSFIEELKQIFNNYNGMTASMKNSLRPLGLEVIEDGNHNYLRFIDDDRYKAVFAKTPSDRRVGSNIIRDVKSALL